MWEGCSEVSVPVSEAPVRACVGGGGSQSFRHRIRSGFDAVGADGRNRRIYLHQEYAKVHVFTRQVPSTLYTPGKPFSPVYDITPVISVISRQRR